MEIAFLRHSSPTIANARAFDLQAQCHWALHRHLTGGPTAEEAVTVPVMARKVQVELDEAQQHFFAVASVGSERNSTIPSQEIHYKCSHESCTEGGPNAEEAVAVPMMATRYPHLQIQKNCRISRCQDQSLMLAPKVQVGLDEAQQHFFAAASV